MAFTPGFNFYEAKECLALSANVEGQNTPTTSTDAASRNALPIITESNLTDSNSWIPKVPDIENWDIVVDPTESIGLDNYWRLYQSQDNPHCYAVAIRGTISTPKSVFADLMIEMLNTEGSLRIQDNGDTQGYQFNYKLAEQNHAGVHLGFLYSLGALLNPNWEFSLLKHMTAAVKNEATEFYITGHSQGAAIATLLRAYLEYQPIGKNISYKTYVFAQPKPGNDIMACNFDQLFSTPMLAFKITNSLDWVPQAPLTLQTIGDLSKPNPITAICLRLADLFAWVVKFRIKLNSLFSSEGYRQTLNESMENQQFLTATGTRIVSLNYSGMGNPIALRGDAEISKNHPKDMFAQHHLGVYWQLMKKYL